MEFLDGYQAIISCKTPKAVTRVRISGYDLDAALRSIKTFESLEIFECSWGGTWSHIPDAILKLPKLKSLAFPRNYLRAIPPEIIYAEKLEVLDLSNNYIREIPSEISQLKYLEELNLDKNPIQEIDEAILELPQLQYLNISKAVFTQAPDILLKLIPKLQFLFLPRKLTLKLKATEAELLSQLPYFDQWTALEKKYIKKLMQMRRKKELDNDLLPLAANILAGAETKILAQQSLPKLLRILNLKGLEILRLKTLEVLDQYISKEALEALEKDARVVVKGRLGINKNELRQKLKDHKIQYSAKLDDRSTHLLVGQLPGNDLDDALQKGLHIITEKNIIDYWESVENPYLLETAEIAPEQLDGLAAMLMSRQNDSIAVALEMFKQGGFPKSLLTELFIAYKSLLDQPKIQRSIERLLRQYGSSDLIAALNLESGVFNYPLAELSTNSYLNKYAKVADLDSIKLARYVFKQFGGGAIYLIRKLPEAEALSFIETDLMKEGGLNLAQKGLNTLPPVVYKLGDKLRELNLQNNRISKVYEKIKAFSNLRVLDLRYNYSLQYHKDRLRTNLRQWLPHCKVLL